jgi:hypothetical protein
VDFRDQRIAELREAVKKIEAGIASDFGHFRETSRLSTEAPPANHRWGLELLVEANGIEPMTFALRTRRSPN